MTVVLFVSLFFLFLLGVPIAISMGAASVIALLALGGVPLIIVAQRSFTSLDSFPLMAIPFFILAGTIMEVGGISRRLINLANAFTGHFVGGIGIVAVITSLFFSAISGSGAATVAAIGSILIPAMIARGYDRGFAGAIQSVSGELGIIIPPSIPLILYGISTGTSISDLFMAGFVPGLLIALSLLLTAYFIAKKRGYKGMPKASWSERMKYLKEAVLALFLPVIILGGIYSGIFTPTEAGAVGVLFAFVVSVLVYKELNIKQLVKLFSKSAVTTSIILYIIANAGLFSWILTREGIPQKIGELFIQISDSPIIFLIMANILLLIFGMFMDTGATVIILAPLLTPIAISMGIDPVHFGIVMIVNLAMGLCTPPLGVNLFISCQIANIRLGHISRALIPFFIVLIVDLLLISYIPAISLSMVNLFK
ncbi:TRAP transporter large permease [Paenibacillus sp. GCM10027626]|uniref:TRAP transporter large permease n=1 Tax=Paenibacillus sp. GCM10027626 TaxID=3273411 RepID=UPI0036409380